MGGDVDLKGGMGSESSWQHVCGPHPQFSTSFLFFDNWHLPHSFLSSLSQNVFGISDASSSASVWQVTAVIEFFIQDLTVAVYVSHINCGVSVMCVGVA